MPCVQLLQDSNQFEGRFTTRLQAKALHHPDRHLELSLATFATMEDTPTFSIRMRAVHASFHRRNHCDCRRHCAAAAATHTGSPISRWLNLSSSHWASSTARFCTFGRTKLNTSRTRAAAATARVHERLSLRDGGGGGGRKSAHVCVYSHCKSPNFAMVLPCVTACV